MTNSDWVAIGALLVSIISFIMAYVSYQSSKRTAMLQVNLDLITKGNDLLKDNFSLLELHGVNLEKLKKLNVTKDEFIYILNSFYAGQAFHYINQSPFRVKLTNYRKIMLDNPKVEIAWKEIIRTNLIGVTKYVKAIDKYYKNKEAK